MTLTPRPRSGVVICGAYGMGNAGDDAVLEAVIAAMRQFAGDMPITVMARHPKAVSAQYGVHAVHPLRVLRWRRAMRHAALFISGGGSLLQDVTSRRSLWYYLTAIREAKRAGCAVQLYGCGIGPLSESGRVRTAAVLNECADTATLRDQDSLDLLRAIGVTRPQMLLSADPALSLPSSSGVRERSIGFALRDWENVGELIPAFAEAAQHAYKTYKLTPVFLCFTEADRVTAQSVMALLKDIPCSATRKVRRTGRMTLVVSMRLHGLVFALRDGAPALGISYDPKVASFCRESGLPCLALGEVSGPALCRSIDEASQLDAETLSAAAVKLRRREKVNAHAAAVLLSEAAEPRK